jgi:TolB protein
MKVGSLGKLMLVGAAALVAACATTQPNSVRVDLVQVQVIYDDDEFVPMFRMKQTSAALDVADGNRVANLKQLTDNAERSTQFSRPAISPIQDAMVYVEFADGKSGIYRQSLGSRAKSPIATDAGINLTPTFTPNGNFLIFSSDRSGENQSLWRKRSDGAGGITQITSSNSFDWQPTVASDGETIIFQSHRRNNEAASIWSINMNGGLLTQLSDGRSPSVSPDGRRIVFVRPDAKTGKDQVWSMLVDGSGLTQLSSGQANDVDPSWHPNGRYIVFASDATTGEDDFADFNIWLMRADGTERVQLTENFSHDDAPVFERRGRTIVFRSNRGGRWNLFSFNPQL